MHTNIAKRRTDIDLRSSLTSNTLSKILLIFIISHNILELSQKLLKSSIKTKFISNN